MDGEWELSGKEPWGSALDTLEHSLKLLSDQARTVADSSELGDRCVRLSKARQQLDGILASTISDADSAGVAIAAGQRTMAQYLASRTHLAPEVVRSDTRVGNWVRPFAFLQDAMLDGTMSRAHVDHVRKLANIRTTSAILRDQWMFIDWVRNLEWKSFKNACAYWLLVNDQDGEQPEDHNPKNTVTMHVTADGRVKGSFDLDPISGGMLRQQLGDEENALFNQDQECGTPRTVAQRRAQAFTNVIARGANRTETTSKPLIHVVMSLKVMQHAIAQMAKDPEDQDFTSVLDTNNIDGRCELIDGTPIHPKYALVLLMQARLRRQVLGAKNVTLDASYETRAFPDHMKYIRLVETRGQCVTAGCDAQHTWLHADHREPCAKHGQTTLANLDPLCGPDNKAKGAGPTLKQRDFDWNVEEED